LCPWARLTGGGALSLSCAAGAGPAKDPSATESVNPAIIDFLMFVFLLSSGARLHQAGDPGET